MNQDQDRADFSFDRPIMPPEMPRHAVRSLLRWAVAIVVLIALVIGFYRVYVSLVGGMAAQHAATADEAPQTAVSVPPTNGDGKDGSSGQPVQPGAAADEPPAPAVVGGAVNKCVAGSQVIYTNAPCPAGSSLATADPAGEAVPLATLPMAPSGDSDPSQQQANCNFLSAELARLNYEFEQPLPPTVLDDISTRLSNLRAQTKEAGCAASPPAQPASSAASAPNRPRPAKGKVAADQASN
jgi:hypothetical protein